MKLYPSEQHEYIDSVTGRKVIQWTNSPAKDQHLYFTCPSVTQDDRWLVFISERTGHPNLYAIDRSNGTIHQLSHNNQGLLRSYVYPQGTKVGLSKASPCLDVMNNRVFFIENNIVKCVDLESKNIVNIFKIPQDWWTAYTHISHDSKYLCIPCTDPDAFLPSLKTQWDQLKSVPKQINLKHLSSRLYRINLETGEGNIWVTVPFWVTHVQFSPIDHCKLIFNQEGFGDHCVPRIWCLEWNGEYRPLFDQKNTIVCTHENWSLDGSYVIYHGWERKKAFLEARSWEGVLMYRSTMPSFSLGHVTPAPENNFVIDGIDDAIHLVKLKELKPNLSNLLIDQVYSFFYYIFCREKIQKIYPPLMRKILKLINSLKLKQLFKIVTLCKHNTDPSLTDQDAHVHAAITPSLNSLIFTSNCEQTCNVYEVILN